MTTGEIFLIVLIKGALVALLVKKGWWPDWEARALKREEHKRVLAAYEEWRERTGSQGAAHPRVVNEPLTRSRYRVRPAR
jgi:hypothetical protein